MLWALGGLVVVLGVAGLALQFAISRNGPAVLSAVDRITGGSGDAQVLANISTGEDPAQKLIVWGPEGGKATKAPVLLFVHGGSWRSGDPDDYGFLARAFVPKGFVVILAGYRLVPGGEYPAMLEDTARAIGWTRKEIAHYGGDPDQIVIAGHSAGAYNVVMTALEPRWLEAEGVSPDDIAGVVGLSGPYDFYPFTSDSTKAAFGDAPEPEATQPITHVRKGAPPILLIHGDKDDLVKPRNTRELAKRLKASGGQVETLYYPEMTHNDPLISIAAPWRSGRDVDDRIAAFALSPGQQGEPSVPVQGETR